MTWVDVAVLAGLAVSGLIGLLRGFVREVLGIAGWVGAGIIAVWAHRPVVAWLAPQLGPHSALADPLAYGLTFVVALTVLLVLTHLISRGVHRVGLGGIDRLLGLVFGLARGAAVVAVAYMLAQMLIPVQNWPPAVRQSRSLPLVYDLARWAVDLLPPAERPRLLAPSGKPPAGLPAGLMLPSVPRPHAQLENVTQ